MIWLVIVTFALSPARGTVDHASKCQTQACVAELLKSAQKCPRVVKVTIIDPKTDQVVRTEFYL